MLMDETNPLDYEILEEALIAVGAPFSLTFLHGCMAAQLCIGDGHEVDVWRTLEKTYFFLQDPQSTINKLFKVLFFRTLAELRSEGVMLTLMLPDESYSLVSRLESLVDWCEGFLQGLSCQPPEGFLELPQVKEIIEDFTHLKEISCQEEETEENEKAYTEMVEFVRVAVLLVREEFLGLHSIEKPHAWMH